MTVRAHIISRHAFLFDSFGREFAARKFPVEVINTLPKFVRGKHVGETKAVLCWDKVESGGWIRDETGGHVEKRVGKVINVTLRELPAFGKDPCSGRVIAVADADA